ncbi:hypothetical protein GCM10009557_03440 [Virgisporangium ochraceum]|uniref:NADH:ubiquinone oxidoreductase-like 20kDa subunit domain-containing protein n=1 Tax=Virgisporangium ochraceum TaxID=65505 RepID=A0A8J4EG01_9ACTN|nr:hypothetical protein [Virgisporangium ochraceum]GIJ70632.1 hypothetical protein Voc01_055490 [Virgisporangium ochraceum]
MRSNWLRTVAGLLRRPSYVETSRRAVRTSVFIRHLDGGSSNAVESELVALGNPIFDVGQYGIRFVASPRHADLLLLTGPLTYNMLGAVRQAFEVMTAPRTIITVGDFADFARLHRHSDAVTEKVTRLYESSYATVDLPPEMIAAIAAHVPGDPPEPADIVEGLLSVVRSRRSARSRDTNDGAGPPGRV